MKIAFFTEGGWEGKIERTHRNMRTDLAWICALEATHLCLNNFHLDRPFDIGIIILPKSGKYFESAVINAKKICKKVAIMQEGPRNYWEDYKWETQVDFYNALNAADFILCHNLADKRYYEGLIDGKFVYTMPPLMIEDSILNEINSENNESKSGVMVGGNMASWYGGFPSTIIAHEFDEKISIPSMGRRQLNENLMWPEVEYLSYMNWVDWIKELSKRKYAVHLMPTHAAGTFALNCAALGIPCIGYNGLDSQESCFPNLSVELGDVSMAKKLAKSLKNDSDFYGICSYIAKQRYSEMYNEAEFVSRMYKIFENELSR